MGRSQAALAVFLIYDLNSNLAVYLNIYKHPILQIYEYLKKPMLLFRMGIEESRYFYNILCLMILKIIPI